MRKKVLKVPKGIRYISDWPDYNLSDFDFPHILNKTLTGCGYTENCIRNGMNIILCSPRRILLENKEDQHQGNLFYVRNEIEKVTNFEKDFSRDPKPETNRPQPSVDVNETAARIMQLKDNIRSYWNSCKSSPFSPGKPCKLLVTYDSFRHVKEALGKDIENFYIVIDEFQSIFCDAKFKSDTELEFVEELKSLRKVCFVSATPMLEKYLDMLEEFKDLPYFELDWESEEPGRVIKPHLEVKYCGKRNTIQQAIKRIIEKYKSGNFDSYRFTDSNGNLQEIQSKEAVIYVNSVKDICRAIKASELTIDQCNVLVSRTKENEKLIRKAFDGKVRDKIEYIGKVPKYGEPHKMFTFCTRTVYLGADFYSTNAKSYIFSNANIDCLSVDISMDLPQILGRQRLVENPWKNSAELYITLRIDDKSPEEFSNYLKKKIESTNDLLSAYKTAANDGVRGSLATKYEKDAKNSNYKDDYVAVNRHNGSSKLPVFNNLMLVSEMRTFEIQEVDYADRFTVFSSLQNCYNTSVIDKAAELFLKEFNSMTIFRDKMKLLCDSLESGRLSESLKVLVLDLIPMEYKNYILTLGINRIRANSYTRNMLEKEFESSMSRQNINWDLAEKIKSTFIVGEKYTKAEIKEKLREIYKSFEYFVTPKATDLEQWFDVKETKITNSVTKKRDMAYEIISKKF